MRVNIYKSVKQKENSIKNSLEKPSELSKVKISDYSWVFSGEVDTSSLETLFILLQKQNPKCPKNFPSSSLAIEDVVEVIHPDLSTTLYHCTPYGFMTALWN